MKLYSVDLVSSLLKYYMHWCSFLQGFKVTSLHTFDAHIDIDDLLWYIIVKDKKDCDKLQYKIYRLNPICAL